MKLHNAGALTNFLLWLARRIFAGQRPCYFIYLFIYYYYYYYYYF